MAARNLSILCWDLNSGTKLIIIDGDFDCPITTEPSDRKSTSPRRDLNARPKVYETFALPAELLGQNRAISAARYLMLRAKINITEISFLVV